MFNQIKNHTDQLNISESPESISGAYKLAAWEEFLVGVVLPRLNKYDESSPLGLQFNDLQAIYRERGQVYNLRNLMIKQLEAELGIDFPRISGFINELEKIATPLLEQIKSSLDTEYAFKVIAGATLGEVEKSKTQTYSIKLHAHLNYMTPQKPTVLEFAKVILWGNQDFSTKVIHNNPRGSSELDLVPHVRNLAHQPSMALMKISEFLNSQNTKLSYADIMNLIQSDLDNTSGLVVLSCAYVAVMMCEELQIDIMQQFSQLFISGGKRAFIALGREDFAQAMKHADATKLSESINDLLAVIVRNNGFFTQELFLQIFSTIFEVCLESLTPENLSSNSKLQSSFIKLLQKFPQSETGENLAQIWLAAFPTLNNTTPRSDTLSKPNTKLISKQGDSSVPHYYKLKSRGQRMQEYAEAMSKLDLAETIEPKSTTENKKLTNRSAELVAAVALDAQYRDIIDRSILVMYDEVLPVDYDLLRSNSKLAQVILVSSRGDKEAIAYRIKNFEKIYENPLTTQWAIDLGDDRIYFYPFEGRMIFVVQPGKHQTAQNWKWSPLKLREVIAEFEATKES